MSAEDSATIRLGHWPSEHRPSAASTRCLTCRARIRSRLCPLTLAVPSQRTIFWLLISDANVRDHRRRPAGGRGALAARVTAGCRSVHRSVRFSLFPSLMSSGRAVDIVGGGLCYNPSRPLAQRVSPECSSDEVLDASSAGTVAPESTQKQRHHHPRQYSGCCISSERPRSPAAAGWRSGCFSSPSDSRLPFGASHCSPFLCFLH